MNPTWHYILTPRAQRDMRATTVDTRRRIFAALDRFAAGVIGSDVRKLQGVDDEWRLRVGDWRVRFRYDSPALIVVVLRVLPRGRAYRD